VAHLGERLTALVDGQLPPDVAERAHVHLAGCRQCRDAVEAERLMKARLGALSGPPPGDDLMQRLLAMGGPNGPLPPRAGHVPGTPRPPAVAVPRVPIPLTAPAQTAAVGMARSWPGGAGPADRPDGRRSLVARRRGGASSGPGRGRVPSGRSTRGRARLAVAVFGALSVVGVGITSLTAGGAGAVPASPTVVPPVDTFVIDHARTTDTLPFVDVPAGWQLVLSDQGGGAAR